ncbi:MAG: single-stranded-DNA-specific exonuclease RecJ [bacterium]|nr:single-stranded-DNA-specific exonuclease RecJ [bacterium]
MKKKWQIAEGPSAEYRASLADVNPVVAGVLWNRGLRSEQAARAFLNDSIDPLLAQDLAGDGSLLFYDPFLFRDMKAAVALIISHIKAGHKIVVYGDYDADGVTASAVLAEALHTLRADVEVYLPDRVTEGYGLNKPALNQIKEQGVSLVITVDNGIRNKAEVEYGKELGLDIIITDHHVLPEKREDMPSCLVIDPADSEDKYPWPFLAGVGVSFKLVCAILQESKLKPAMKKLIAERSLDLVAVGTIADMVSLMGENRWLVKRGMTVLNQNRRAGLRALFKTAKIAIDKPLEAWNVGWQLGPRLNAASRIGHANSAFALISASNEEEAQSLAEELNKRNQSRQLITEEIIKQVEAQIDKDNLPPLIIGLCREDQSWNEGVVGLVSGRICEKYHRPTLVITRTSEEGAPDAEDGSATPAKSSFKGSGRSIEGFNLIAAVEECSDYLDKYGGHPMACGFSVESEERLNLFKEKLLAIAAERIDAEVLVPKLKLDASLPFNQISLPLNEAINELSPFGQNNQQPRFASYGLRVDDVVLMGSEKQHVKLRLSSLEDMSAPSYWGIAFSCAPAYAGIKIGDVIDLAYYLDINAFNGRREVQLKIIDWRPAENI